jgi:pimeloyl-ACP methyl ester carboxylesterase
VSNEKKPNVILVHGAFEDAAALGGVVRELRMQGLDVRAPAVPLRGLASDATALANFATTLEGPIVLAGHSYGAAVMAQAAPLIPAVEALVFFSGFALDLGESCSSVMEPFPDSLLKSTVVISAYNASEVDGGPYLSIQIDQFHRTFGADLSGESAGTMAVSQRPISVSAFQEPATAVGWRKLPSWWMLPDQDNVIHPECQSFMAERMNADVEHVPGGSHAAIITRPDVAATQVLRAVGATWGPI